MDAYQVLGLQRGASEEEVKAAYRALARKYDPSGYEAGPLKEEAERKMDEINAAFDQVMAELKGAPASTGQQPRQGGGAEHSTLPQIRALLQQGRADEALAQLQAIPDGPASAEWNFLMGSAYYYKGWLNEALRYFQEACRLAPSNREYAAALHNLQSAAGGQMPGNPYGGYGAGPQANAVGCSCCDLCTAMMCMDMCCSCGRM